MPGILLGDLRYAVRTLCKSPGFTAVVVLPLALGIGATSTIFSAFNPILLRPLPFADPDRLVAIYGTRADGTGQRPPTTATFLEWRDSPVFEELEWAGRFTYPYTYPGIDGAEQHATQYVSPGLFRFLGVEPILGRNFVAEDARIMGGRWGSYRPGQTSRATTGSSAGVILSYGFWQRRFGSDPDILGQAWANGVVVGVMPPGFRIFPQVAADFWAPLDSRFAQYDPIGRLKPGVSIEVAQTQLEAITSRREDPWGNGVKARVRVDPLKEYATRDYARHLYLLMGAALLVLLIACSNVASLLVGRATNRNRELTTRAALGAGRLRLMRQLLTESVVLALFGAALGVAMALVGTRLFVILNPTWYLPVEEIRIDGMVLGFTLGLSLLTAILFGTAPALRASNPDLAKSLKQGGRGSPGGSRPLVQNLLVGSQVALTLVLLTGAALMVNSFVRLGAVDRGFYSEWGFNPERLLTAQVNLESERYVTTSSEENREITVVSPEANLFYREVIERLRALPGVEAAEIGPAGGQGSRGQWSGFNILGRPALPPGQFRRAYYTQSTPGYFRVMGIPLLKGRFFTERDTETSSGVAIINENLALDYFPDEDPIGKFLESRFEVSSADPDKPREIVGIVGNVNQGTPRLGKLREAAIYVPNAPHPTEFAGPQNTQVHVNRRLVIKTTLEPMELAVDLRRTVAEVDPEVAVFGIETMQARLDQTVNSERFWMRALGIFATLALLLAVVGIYGVVSYAVGQRTHEIGVRMALGAQRTDVLGMVVRQGMVTTVVGVIVGVLGAVAATRLISSQLYGVEATDPATFAAVSLVLVGIAVLASYVPARRAARVDPLIALRSE